MSRIPTLPKTDRPELLTVAIAKVGLMRLLGPRSGLGPIDCDKFQEYYLGMIDERIRNETERQKHEAIVLFQGLTRCPLEEAATSIEWLIRYYKLVG